MDRVQDRLPRPARDVVRRAREDDVLLLGASLAFYAMVSIVPMVVLSLWIAGLIVGDARVEAFSDRLRDLAPRNVGLDQAIRAVADQGTRLGLSAAAAGLWPATAYGSGLAQAFDRLTPSPDRRRTPVIGRLFVLVVILPLFILGSIVASFAGTKVLGDALVGQLLGVVVALVSGFVMAAGAILLVYAAFPAESLQWQAIFKATGFTAAGVSILSLALVLYVNLGADFQERYATSGMAAVILLAVWLYLSNVLLLVGYKIALEADPTSERRRPAG